MSRRTFTLICALFSIALACTIRPAHAGSPYEAFRFPDVHSQRLNTGAAFFMNSFRGAQPTGAARQYVIASQFTLSGERLDQTDRHSREIGLNVVPFTQRSLDRVSTTFGSTISSQALDGDVSQVASLLRWSESWFTADSRWGVGSSFQFRHEYLRSGQESRLSNLTLPDESISASSSSGHAYLAAGVWTIDVGRGRVRDVTGVLRAAVLEERLDRFGRLAHPLSDAARLRMAQLFSAEDGFSAAHDEPAKAFWREVARILREDGALKNGELDAEALARVQEDIAPRAPFDLARGTRVAAIVELSRFGGHSDSKSHVANVALSSGVVVNSNSFDAASSSRQDTRRSRVGVEVMTSHPVGLLSQWAVDWRLLTGDGPARSLEMTTEASYQRMLLHRLYASASGSHRTLVTKMGDAYGLPAWTAQLAGQLSYLIEDRWSVDMRVSHLATADRVNRINAAPPGFFDAETMNRLSIGLTWRPSGRFDSPTLGVHERPMAMAR